MSAMTIRPAAALSRRRRRLRAGATLFLVLALVWITASAALAQFSPNFSLGCWGVVTAGGGTRASTTFRTLDSLTSVGGAMQSTTARIDANHAVLLRSFRPPVGPVQPPATNTTVLQLPLIFGQDLLLQNLCR